MGSIKAMCPRVIYLRKGEVVFDGATEEGLDLYETGSKLSTLPWFRSSDEAPPVTITNVELLTADGEPKTIFDYGERLLIRIAYSASRTVPAPHFVCAVKRSDDVMCCNFSSWADRAGIATLEGDGLIEVLTPPLSLVAERYTIDILVRENNTGALVAAQSGASFHVRHEIYDPTGFGVFHEQAKWSHGRTQ
jgi:lipopolysaccharide transport system ATP-binding protein